MPPRRMPIGRVPERRSARQLARQAGNGILVQQNLIVNNLPERVPAAAADNEIPLPPAPERVPAPADEIPLPAAPELVPAAADNADQDVRPPTPPQRGIQGRRPRGHPPGRGNGRAINIRFTANDNAEINIHFSF